MNKKGQLDELNPTFMALAAAGALLSFLIIGFAQKFSSGFEVSLIIKILTPICTFIVIYIYLILTDR